MSFAGGVARSAAGLVLVVSVAACGGKIDGYGDGDLPPGSGPVGGPRPPSTRSPRPARPPPPPTTAASAAAEIAEQYCKTFSSCCVGIKQPPIDVTRCRELLVSASVARRVEPAAGPLESSEVAACVSAIRTRTAACGQDDFPWWTYDVALFAPDSVRSACAPLIGATSARAGQPCSAGMRCSDGATCAIDVCVATASPGESCVSAPCTDRLSCSAGVCTEPASRAAGEPCSATEDCRLGLVCSEGTCEPARAHPEQYRERHSPYRVGSDTCRVFTSL